MVVGKKRNLAFAIAIASAIYSGCGEDWEPISTVSKLRVLAIRAEPADLAPGQITKLDALVIDPRDPTRQNTLIWLACDPDPSSLTQSDCAKYTTLEDTEQLSDIQTLPEGVRTLGVSYSPGFSNAPSVYFSAKSDLFSKLSSDDEKRQKGVLAFVLLLSIATPPPATYPPTTEEINALMQKVQKKEVDYLLSLKRVKISESSTKNKNPQISGVRFGTEFWAPGLRPIKLEAAKTYGLTGESVAGSSEHYSTTDVDGNVIEKDERLIFSWFTTVGELDIERTISGETGQLLALPETVNEMRRGLLYMVLRDGRGGTDFAQREMFYCDPALDAPTITSVEPASAKPGAQIRIKGTGLDNLLDVSIRPADPSLADQGLGFLADGSWNAAEETYTGYLPLNAPSGSLLVTARGKGCKADPAFEITVSVK